MSSTTPRTPTPLVLMVGDLGGQVTAHLVRALVEHDQWCRTNGVGVPAELRGLLGALSARSGQERPTSPSSPAPGEGDRMLLALDYEAVATRLGVSVRTVRRLVSTGDLPAVSISGCRRVRATDLIAYVESLEG